MEEGRAKYWGAKARIGERKNTEAEPENRDKDAGHWPWMQGRELAI